MLRLLLLLPLLGAVGALPAPLRRHRRASLPVGPYLTRYLSQQVGAGCGGRDGGKEFPWGAGGTFPVISLTRASGGTRLFAGF